MGGHVLFDSGRLGGGGGVLVFRIALGLFAVLVGGGGSRFVLALRAVAAFWHGGGGRKGRGRVWRFGRATLVSLSMGEWVVSCVPSALRVPEDERMMTRNSPGRKSVGDD